MTNEDPLKQSLDLPEDMYPEDYSKKTKKVLWTVVTIIISVVLLGGVAYGFWVLVFHKNKPAAKTAQSTTQSPPPTKQEVASATLTKTYESPRLPVVFSYPGNWTVSEATGGIRVVSPDFPLETLDKGRVTADFRVYIRQGARDVDSKYIGRGVVIKPSEKLVYKQPAVGQRTDTNLSSFGLDTPDNFAFFLIAGNFSLHKGDTLGPGYGTEPQTYIITGGYSSNTLTDDLATYQVSTETYQNNQAYKQAIAILESLQLK